MKKKKIWKMLAAAGSFAVLVNGQAVMKACAQTQTEGACHVIADPGACSRLLMEAVSSVPPGERSQISVTGENFEPQSLIIAQMFPDAVNISNTKVEEHRENGKRYVTCRIGFERACGESPPKPQIGEGESTGERFWSVGEVVSRRIGETVYTFCCVDDDYRNENSDHQIYALFLCDAVIRSDVDSTDSKREILTFGENNNYKTSAVRKWLSDHTGEDCQEMEAVSTGVSSAWIGETEAGAFHEFSGEHLDGRKLPVQVMEDRLFCLSMEEALRYRETMWEVSGGESPYSRGYWLRTPAFEADETGAFRYGKRVYGVDLETGCIRQVSVSDGGYGLRPAFCLPQA